jgi:hypothetical protein
LDGDGFNQMRPLRPASTGERQLETSMGGHPFE